MPDAPTLSEIIDALRTGCVAAIGDKTGEARQNVLVSVLAAQILELIEEIES